MLSLQLAYILRASLITQLVKNPPAMQETLVQFLGQEAPHGGGTGYPLQYSWASLVAQLVKNAGDLSSIPGLGRFPGEGHGKPLHYSCLTYSPHGHK